MIRWFLRARVTSRSARSAPMQIGPRSMTPIPGSPAKQHIDVLRQPEAVRDRRRMRKFRGIAAFVNRHDSRSPWRARGCARTCLPPAQTHRDAALQRGQQTSRDLLRARARELPITVAKVRSKRAARLSPLRRLRSRIRARALRRVRARSPRGVFVQSASGVSELCGATDGEQCGASRRPRVAERAGSAVGFVATVRAASTRSLRCKSAHRVCADLH